ncbi:MAG: AraC family transcriptional regulator [Moorea sp. SIO2I5]|nr:AraC family transcriptional regulator [Moorena sp. SIO2I5]
MSSNEECECFSLSFYRSSQLGQVLGSRESGVGSRESGVGSRESGVGSSLQG